MLLRSFVQLLTFDRGFETSHVVTATVTNPMGVLPHEVAEQWPRVLAEQQRLQERLSAELRTRLASIADVQAVGLARYLPFGRNRPSEAPLRLAGVSVPGDANEMVQTENCRWWLPATWTPCGSGCRRVARSPLGTGARARVFSWPTKRWPADFLATGRPSAGG